MTYIFDTSAIIALLRDEEGSDVVERIILNAPGSCCMHSVNYVELYYKMGDKGGAEAAKTAVNHLRHIGISVMDISGEAFLQRVGQIKNLFPALSLGDSFAVGLSEWVRGTVVTADKQFSNTAAITGIKQFR